MMEKHYEAPRNFLLRIVPLVVVIGLIAAACTGSGTSSSTTVNGDESDTTGAAEPTDGLKVVPFLTAESSPDAVAQITGLIAEFEAENPGVAIELQLVSNDQRGPRIINAVTVGEELGIFELDRRLGADFTNAGYLLPLDSIVDKIGPETFVPGSLLYWPWDGHIYLFTSDISSTIMAYRQDLYDDAGLAPPSSYEDYLAASEALDGVNGISGNSAETSVIRAFRGYSGHLWQTCGDYFTKDGELALDSDEARQAAHDYAALLPFSPEGNHTWGGLDAITAYAAGRAAHVIHQGRAAYVVGTDAAPEIEAGTAIKPLEVWHEDQTEHPLVNPAHATTYAIGSTVKYPEEAKAFLEFLFTGDNLVQYSMGVPGHIVPPQKDAQAAVLEQDNEYVQEHRDWIETIFAAADYFNDENQNMGSMEGCTFNKSLTPVPWASLVFGSENPIATMFQEILLQGRDVDDAFDDAVASFEAAIESYEAENGEFEPPDGS